jgi:hypothetical protein
MKAYPTPQTSTVSLQISQAVSNMTNLTSRWWNLAANIHAELPRIKDGGGQGYYSIFIPPAAPTFNMSFSMCHYDSTNDTIDSLWSPIKDLLDKQLDMVNYTYAVYAAPTFFDMWNTTTGQGFEAVATGGGWLASRLLTRRALTENSNAVAQTFETVAPIIAGNMIANDRNRGLDIALNPGWRDTVSHVIVVSTYSDGDPPEVQQKVINETQSIKGYALKQLSPESGAYFNEVQNTPKLLRVYEVNEHRLTRTSRIGNIRSLVRTMLA